MRIVIGSESGRKIDTATRVLKEVLGHDDFSVLGCAALSGVPETPWDEETFKGARNRAQHSQELVPGGDYFLGVESGLVGRYGKVFEEAWCCVLGAKATEAYGYSSGLELPRYVVDAMQYEGHAAVMARLEETHGIQHAMGSDTWGSYTGGVLLRDTSIAEAVRNALVQAFPQDGSFYKLG